jgi:hypothetical protein
MKLPPFDGPPNMFGHPFQALVVDGLKFHENI